MYSTGGNSRESPGDSVIPKDEPCQAINEETGDICGETESLRILEEFRKLYETRISKVEEEPENPNVDRVSRKLEIMMDWVKDLGEQNVMLVRTVEELERAACSRVKVLEERLKQSSNLVAENISRAHQTDETLSVLTNRVSQLEKDEEFLQQKIDFLQSDIRGLLELIRRARRENCWSLEGITFFEIQPGDIPPPLDCSCAQETNDVESIQSLKLQVEQLQESEKKALLYQAELEDKLASLNKKVLLKEETLRKYISKLQNLRDNLKKRSSSANQIILGSPATNTDLGSAIDTMADIVESTLSAKDLEVEDAQRRLRDVEAKLEEIVNEKNLETASLHRSLEEKCVVIRQTEYRLAHLQKESVETRDVLVAEVAEKHDLVLSLRKEVAALGERCRQMDVQMHFKDDIIKEMRKELKIARSKSSVPFHHIPTSGRYPKITESKYSNPVSMLHDKFVQPPSPDLFLRPGSGKPLYQGLSEGTIHYSNLPQDPSMIEALDDLPTKGTSCPRKCTRSEILVGKKQLREADRTIVKSSGKLRHSANEGNLRQDQLTHDSSRPLTNLKRYN